MEEKKYTFDLAGKTITASFTNLAEQAGGSVIMSCDETVVLATACISKDGKDNRGFFNLTVEYIERYYAAGKILGSQWNKREGRPSDQAILAGRIIDRTIRPLFPHHIKNAVQVVVTVLAVGKMDPKILAVNAASLAISCSPIPWRGPVGAVSITAPVGTTELLINNYLPTVTEPTNEFDLVVCGRDGKICMIESMAFEYGNEKMGQAFDLAMEQITKIENWQKEIILTEGHDKMVFENVQIDTDVKKRFDNEIKPLLSGKLYGKDGKKIISESEEKWKAILSDIFTTDDDKELKSAGEDYFHDMLDKLFHDAALVENKRADLRDFTEVRSLYAKAGGLSPVLHGTGIFYRGETHVLSVLALGGPDSRQMIEGIEAEGEKRFMHHYNFPPYSVGETGRFGGLNRREMGHGFLAEKALVPVLPSRDVFPYTIRVVSESTSSNGSTSQASICASSIALMDGGVPISAPVAGIAMGLMMDETNPLNYKILTDIQGPEDHFGDMDFKVAGTQKGITAIQLDIKTDGIPVQILKEALVDAQSARNKILDVILKEIAAPRTDISSRAPRIVTTHVLVEQIGMVIGPGGKMVNKIREDTKTEITIEDDGMIYITGIGDGPLQAKTIIDEMTRVYKIGDIIQEAEVVRVADFGAFVKIGASNEALVHVSEIAPFRVEQVSDYLKVGMKMPVQIVKVEEGKVGASIKALNPNLFPKPEPKK